MANLKALGIDKVQNSILNGSSIKSLFKIKCSRFIFKEIHI